MYQSDSYGNYGKIPLIPTEMGFAGQDDYYSTQYNVNDNNQLSSVECGNDTGGMYQISQAFMDGIYSNNEIKSLKFDPHEELLWSISTNGHLCAFYEFNLTKFVSVEVPELNRRPSDPIYETVGLLVGGQSTLDLSVVYVLGRTELLVYNKTGSLRQRHRVVGGDPSAEDGGGGGGGDGLECFCSHSSKPGTLVLGRSAGLVEFDVETARVASEVKLPGKAADDGKGGAAAAMDGTRAQMALLQYSRGLLCSTGDGQIVTVDLRDRHAVQHSFRPHSVGLSDFSVNYEGYAVLSCGTYRCNQQLYADQFLKVYDLRYKKTQCPIKVEMQPGFVRFMPVFNDSMLVASASGQFQVANFGQNVLGLPSDQALLLNEYDSIKAVDISSNSKLIAFGTGSGLISLTSNSCTDLTINSCSGETAFPAVPTYMSMDCVAYDDPRFIITSSEFVTEPLDKTRFSKLSSDWPSELCSGKYRKIKPVDMSLFTQYPSKFKAELIGRRPSNWGPVWFPY